jgi:hypothetical protein
LKRGGLKFFFRNLSLHPHIGLRQTPHKVDFGVGRRYFELFLEIADQDLHKHIRVKFLTVKKDNTFRAIFVELLEIVLYSSGLSVACALLYYVFL